MEEENKIVMFDASGAVRILDPEKTEASSKAMTAAREYALKMDQFKKVAAEALTVVDQLAQAIEREKLRAIGARNAVETDTEARGRAVREAELRLLEKQAELDRYVAEYQSLVKVEQEQRHVIERLSGND